MRSLLVRIFLSFWLIIGITTGAAAVAGYYYSERMREAVENFEIDETLLEASAVLDVAGRPGLTKWLRKRTEQNGILLYILDSHQQDLLDRYVPGRVRYLMELHHPRKPGARPHRRPPGNLRPARPLSQLVGPNGEVFTLVAIPSYHPYRRWLEERFIPLFLALALLVSGTVSYLLARTLSRPVRHLRDATVAIADGDLNSRVSAKLHNRRDELGQLAQDFDSMAEKLQLAARQQTELSRNISHELRSPLARLRVALELARRRAGELQEFARIDAETERLDSLIGQILSYARLDAGSGEPLAPTDLAGLLTEVVENVNYECRADGIAGVTVRLQADSEPTVPGYAAVLQSAVENILRNAVRHSPPNSSVDVTLGTDDACAHIVVEDSGTGVAENEIGKLFEPFFRTRDALQNGDWPGSGLGLAIAARAVHLHGGTIEAENRPQGGLRVSLKLPLSG